MVTTQCAPQQRSGNLPLDLPELSWTSDDGQDSVAEDLPEWTEWTEIDTAPQSDTTVIPADVSDPEPRDPDVLPSDGCGFDYAFESWWPPGSALATQRPASQHAETWPWQIDRIAHGEPMARRTFGLTLPGTRLDLVMPDYQDSMPLFPRANLWQDNEMRCYETPRGTEHLTQEQAFEMYVTIAETTTAVPVDRTPGVRTVLGLRGTSPGQFSWNNNGINRFNDTLVLLWREQDGAARVLEFAGHTDTGPHDFGWHSSSSLKPNRVYPYVNGWHRNYNALRIQIDAYPVRDDTNKNGHWDSDRNGWWPGIPGFLGDEDHDRLGGAHNIHAASVDGPLHSASVDNWSAGCQLIPGMVNWTQFITHAWTGLGDPVDYHLIDARDIDPTAWFPCQPDGSHQCPFRIEELPFSYEGDTTGWPVSEFDLYNCSPADEGGPEIVWVLNLQQEGTLYLEVDDTPDSPNPDIDIHLLSGDAPDACIVRGNTTASSWLGPGRYVIIADTYVDNGNVRSGPFRLDVWFQPDR
jgi:hypothetical protein